MTLAEVKNYLKVDGDDDDALIQLMMSAAEDFITSAVGVYDDTQNRAKLLYCAVVQDMYDNRQLVTEGASSYTVGQQYRNVINSLIRQLQCEQLLPKEEEENGGVSGI